MGRITVLVKMAQTTSDAEAQTGGQRCSIWRCQEGSAARCQYPCQKFEKPIQIGDMFNDLNGSYQTECTRRDWVTKLCGFQVYLVDCYAGNRYWRGVMIDANQIPESLIC